MDRGIYQDVSLNNCTYTCLFLYFINSDTHFALVTKFLQLVATKATLI